MTIVAAAARDAGYIEQPNDWQVWKGILSDEMLHWKKLEQRFKKQHFEIAFFPLGGMPDSPTFLRLSFYEHDAYVFSDAGISEFEELARRFQIAGLTLLEEAEEDRSSSQNINTPAEFNSTHHAPTAAERSTVWFLGAVGLSVYGLVILLPGFLLMRTLSSVGMRSVRVRRTLFVVLATALLAPAPMMASMFGPFILVPMALGYSFIFSLPESWRPLLLGSFASTFVIALIVSFFYVKATPNADRPPPVT